MSRLFFALLLTLMTAAFALQNTQPVALRFLVREYARSMVFVILARQKWGRSWPSCSPSVRDGPAGQGYARQRFHITRHLQDYLGLIIALDRGG